MRFIETGGRRIRIAQLTMTARVFEPDIKQSTPRRVRLQDPFPIWTFRVVSVVPAIFSFVMLARAGEDTLEFFGHLLFGNDVEGQVVAAVQVRGEKRDAHFVDFTYAVKEQKYSGRARVNRDRFDSLQVGDAIPLQVLPWTPDSARLAIGRGFEFLAVAIAWAIAIVPCTILGGFLWQFYFVPWFQRKLLRNGLVTSAIIRSIESGEGKGYRIGYEYAPAANGANPLVLQGQMTANGPRAEALKVGDVLTVIYDPRRPHRSVLYQFAEYQLVGS